MTVILFACSVVLLAALTHRIGWKQGQDAGYREGYTHGLDDGVAMGEQAIAQESARLRAENEERTRALAAAAMSRTGDA